MATLEGKKIKDTFKSLLKINNNGELNGTLQEVTDGNGNGSGLLINNTGDIRVEGTVEFGSLKDTAENITISKLVDQADGIANNDNDTSIPTSAAVKDYVDNISVQDLDFTGDSGTGLVDLNTQTLNLLGSNGVVTSASGQTITIDTSSLDSRLTTAEADIDTNTADIASEEASRIAADGVLQTNIDSEESARISADNTLQSNIDSEAATRLANDNTLQANIDTEEASRISADTTLQSNIDSEASTRATADTTLQSNIDSEETARASADTTLQANIDSEATARASADTAEAATRLANDNTLQANIDSEASTRATADTNLQSNIDAEAATRLANDNTLQSNIDSEAATRLANDNTLQSEKQDNLTAGTGIDLTANTVTNTAPDQIVSITEGNNITVTGSYPDFTITAASSTAPVASVNGEVGVVVLGSDDIAEGITNLYDKTVTLTEGSNITVTGVYPDFTIAASSSTAPVDSVNGATGVVVLDSDDIAEGSVNLYDKTVAITGSGAATVTGTYPNFNVNATDTDTTYTAGTGIDVTSDIITNTAPDQTVAITGSGAATITGTYPNFNVDSTDTQYTAGVGIDVTGTTITNTSPDQVVSIAGTGSTTVTGTYPNFSVNSTTPPVDSVNGATGIVVLDSDDISQGATNLYNQTHTGEVTGATALTIADDVISYAKLGAEFTTSAALSTDVDFSTAQVFTKTLTAATTLTFSNASIGMVKDLVITGAFALTLPTGSTVAGTYNGAVSNLIQVVVTGAGQYWFSISQAI